MKQEDLETQIQEYQKSFSSDRMDMSFGEITNLYKSNELIIKPNYQRFYRWNDKQKTQLIESLLGIPISPVFVFEDDNGRWELVDGLQRVATVIGFLGEIKTDNFQRKHQLVSKSKYI